MGSERRPKTGTHTRAIYDFLVKAHQQTGLERASIPVEPELLAILRAIPTFAMEYAKADEDIGSWLVAYLIRRASQSDKYYRDILYLGFNLDPSETRSRIERHGGSMAGATPASTESGASISTTLRAREAALRASGVTREALLNTIQKEAELLASQVPSDRVAEIDERTSSSAELFIALVRAIGTKTKPVIDELGDYFRRANFRLTVVELGSELKLVEQALNLTTPTEEDIPRWKYYSLRMNAGDKAREINEGLVAGLAVRRVRLERAGLSSTKEAGHVFVFDSIMHEAEVEVLRQAYGEALVVLSILEPENSRRETLVNDFESNHLFRTHRPVDTTARSEIEQAVDDLINRDDGTKRVSDHQLSMRKVFHLADYSIALTKSSSEKTVKDELPNQLERLFRCLFSDPFITPSMDESGYAFASVAALSTTTLGRRVGACLIGSERSILGVGVNEVPRPGGGLYGEPKPKEHDYRDHKFVRDPYRKDGFARSEERGMDTNTEMRQELIDSMLRRIAQHLSVPLENLRDPGLESKLISDIIEYGRAVHAEMSAILMAIRSGMALAGSTLYCTTLPCHECARHIIAAGISRVVYSEPYPKSKLWELHPDAVLDVSKYGEPKAGDKRVAFVPFRGVSPSQLPKFLSWVERKEEYPSPRADGSGQEQADTDLRPGRAVKWDVKKGPFTVRSGFLPLTPDMRILFLASVEGRELRIVKKFLKAASEQGVHLED